MHHFGVHPRDLVTPPEEGGLTYDELEACLAALDEIRRRR